MTIQTKTDTVLGTPVASKPDPLEDLFTLYFYKGTPHAQVHHYRFRNPDGSIPPFHEIVKKAQIFCEETNKRFVRVEPFLRNMQKEISNHLG